MLHFRFLIAALALFTSPVFASEHLTPAQTMQMAAVRVYNPNGPGQIGGGGHAFGPGFSYVAPLLVNQFGVVFGDSRTANGGGNGWTSPVFGTGTNYSNGFAGWIYPLSANRLLASSTWNYGLGAQSTMGIAGRLFTTGVDCNDSVNTNGAGGNAYCFTGVGVKATGAVAANPSLPTIIPVTSGAGISAGDYVNSNTYTNFLCTVTSVSGNNITVPAGCITTGFATNTVIAFSHPANSSNFATTSNGVTPVGTPTVTDVDKSKLSAGLGTAVSPVTDPAQVVFFLGGTNDGPFATPLYSMQNLQAIFNALGPSGANKIVIAGNEVPTGLATGWSEASSSFNGAPEVNLVGTGPYTYTVTQGASYYDTAQVILVPCGSTTAGTPANNWSCGTTGTPTGFTAAAGDGTQLINCTTGTASAPTGTAACTPAPGQYSVSASGVYTFNSAQSGAKIAIYYRWQNLGRGPFLNAIHEWMNDSTHCSNNFYSATTATTYPISGAQCNTPWLHVADTWGATVDGATSFPKAYVSVDGLHPLPYGGELISQALVGTATAAGAIQATAPFTAPSINNAYFTANSSNSTTNNATTTCSTTTANKYYLNTLSPAASTGYYGPNGVQSTTPPVWMFGTNTGIPAGAKIACIDYTHNQLQLTQPATTTIGTAQAFVQFDTASPPSMIAAGVFNYSMLNTSYAVTGCGASNSNCSTPSLGTLVTKGTPSGWSSFAADTSGTNPTAAAITAGVLGLSYGVESNPFNDGYDDFVIVLQGYSGGQIGTFTLAQFITPNMITTIASGDQHRSFCEILVSAGPNGHLYGVESLAVMSYDATSGTWVPPGLSSGAYSIWQSTHGAGATAFSDASLETGAPNVSSKTVWNWTSPGIGGTPGAAINVLTIPSLSPVSVMNGTASSSKMAVTVGTITSEPVSATVRIRRCGMWKATQ